MIEKTVLDYLNRVLDVPVCMETPEELPDSYVLIEKTGSGRQNRIYSATLAIQSIAASLYEAAKLNEAVKDAMERIVILAEVCRAELNSDYNYTDTAAKQYRYQAVYDLIHY